MGIGLLFIAGCFGLSILSVHAIYYFYKRKKNSKTRIVVITTHNNENQIEREIYSIISRASLRGKYVAITVFDAGSTDDTLSIIERINRKRACIDVHLSMDGLEKFLELHKEDEVKIIPLHKSNKPFHLSALQS